MTIDERIEAIAQSLELLSSFHRDMEVRHQEAQARHQEAEARHREDVAEMRQLFNRLGNIAIRHDEQIEDLGERLKRVEH